MSKKQQAKNLRDFLDGGGDPRTIPPEQIFDLSKKLDKIVNGLVDAKIVAVQVAQAENPDCFDTKELVIPANKLLSQYKTEAKTALNQHYGELFMEIIPKKLELFDEEAETGKAFKVGHNSVIEELTASLKQRLGL